MKVESNLRKKKKKITPEQVQGAKVTIAPKKGPLSTSKTTTKTVRTPGSSKYTPADVRTGHPEYGKESKTKPTPQFVKDAQAQKKDIVMKNGLPYRAGYTEKKEPTVRMTTETKVKPNFKTYDVNVKYPKGEVKASKKKVDKLKPMAMTYGGERKGKGATIYKNKVRSIVKQKKR